MNRRNHIKLGATLLTGLTIAPNIKASNSFFENNEPINSFWDVVKNRRSVRKFKPDPVPDEHIKKIVDAARMAPTSGNQQPWKFLVVKEKEKIESLKNECLNSIKTYFTENKKLTGDELKDQLNKAEKRLVEGYLSAPVFIVVLTDNQSKYPDYNSHDGPLAAGYLMLAARALGYGTVYITDAISVKASSTAFGIPDQYTRVCITPLGIPVEWPTKKKKELDEFIVNESF